MVQSVVGAAAQPPVNPGQTFGLNPELNRRLAAATGFTGNFGQGQFQQFLGQQDPATQALASQIITGRPGGGPALPGVRPIGAVEPLGPIERQAIEALGAGPGQLPVAPVSPFGAQGQQFLGGAQQAIGALQAPFSPQVFQERFQTFQNPFISEVIQNTAADIQRQADIERARIGQLATQAGQFGGARQGVLESELGRNVLEQIGDVSARLRSGGFESARQAALQQLQQEAGQQQAAAQLGLGGFGQTLAGGQQELQRFGQTQAAQTGALNRFLAQQQAALAAGAIPRGINQQLLNIAQQQIQQQQQFPVGNLQSILGLIGQGFPTSGAVSPQAVTQPSALQSALGGFVGAGGLGQIQSLLSPTIAGGSSIGTLGGFAGTDLF